MCCACLTRAQKGRRRNVPNLRELIDECIAAKEGDREFALFSFGDGKWRAEIGNTCPHVMIGEADAEFRGEGETPEVAVLQLIQNVRAIRAEPR